MVADVYDEQVKKLRNLVFGVGILTLIGGNSGSLYSYLHPESVQSIAKEKIVTKDYLAKELKNHSRDIMVITEHYVDEEVDIVKDITNALFDECEKNRREGVKELGVVKLTLAVQGARLEGCIRRQALQ